MIGPHVAVTLRPVAPLVLERGGLAGSPSPRQAHNGSLRCGSSFCIEKKRDMGYPLGPRETLTACRNRQGEGLHDWGIF
jgi:hypothetical protein